MAKDKAAANGNIFSSAINFANESWAEVKKVHYPTRAETIQATAGVLIMVVIFCFALGLIDFSIGHIVHWYLD